MLSAMHLKMKKIVLTLKGDYIKGPKYTLYKNFVGLIDCGSEKLAN